MSILPELPRRLDRGRDVTRHALFPSLEARRAKDDDDKGDDSNDNDGDDHDDDDDNNDDDKGDNNDDDNKGISWAGTMTMITRVMTKLTRDDNKGNSTGTRACKSTSRGCGWRVCLEFCGELGGRLGR